jgi:hypothetical protein
MSKTPPQSGTEMQGRSTKATGQRARFLELLAESSNVTASAAAVGWDRSAAYKARSADEDFKEAWDFAVESATDALEAEARRRALHGYEEYVTCKDGLVRDDQGNPVLQRRFSDSLMTLLLKAHRPDKFKDRAAIENSGRIVINLPSDDAAL